MKSLTDLCFTILCLYFKILYNTTGCLTWKSSINYLTKDGQKFFAFLQQLMQNISLILLLGTAFKYVFCKKERKKERKKKERKSSRHSTTLEFRDRLWQNRLKISNLEDRAVKMKRLFGQHWECRIGRRAPSPSTSAKYFDNYCGAFDGCCYSDTAGE